MARAMTHPQTQVSKERAQLKGLEGKKQVLVRVRRRKKISIKRLNK